MIAHLQNGEYESARILQAETARKMRELLFTHDPRLDGMAYGFMRMQYNGRAIVQHGGDTFWFHSYFVMLPESNAGFFVSYNTDTAGASPRRTARGLSRPLLPGPRRAGRKAATRLPRAGRPLFGQLRHDSPLLHFGRQDWCTVRGRRRYGGWRYARAQGAIVGSLAIRRNRTARVRRGRRAGEARISRGPQTVGLRISLWAAFRPCPWSGWRGTRRRPSRSRCWESAACC